MKSLPPGPYLVRLLGAPKKWRAAELRADGLWYVAGIGEPFGQVGVATKLVLPTSVSGENAWSEQ